MVQITVNMKQFKEKWKDYSDNINFAETIRITNGKFLTVYAEPYINWLNEFNIFYTLKS